MSGEYSDLNDYMPIYSAICDLDGCDMSLLSLEDKLVLVSIVARFIVANLLDPKEERDYYNLILKEVEKIMAGQNLAKGEY